VRNETDDARYSEMPRFGVDEILEPEQIDQVVEFVLQLSGSDFDAALATEGAVVFEDNCTACHGDDGTGDRDVGAPNLADAIWLYGGDRETIHASVSEARFGVMPAWGQRLTQAEVNAAAVYVHTRGGGE
jgi:cytochrome c oxidase cbb3-type subunit 3